MKRLGLVVFGLLAIMVAGLRAADDSEITIMMKKCHKPKAGFRDVIDGEVNKPKPNWSLIQKTTQDFVKETATLPKLKPPTGDKASWARLTATYVNDVQALDAAAAAKNAGAVKAANAKLAGGCQGCHDAHRE